MIFLKSCKISKIRTRYLKLNVEQDVYKRQTLGNALRRVLLSSLPGAAVYSIKVEGVYHEFTSIPGVEEDVTMMILNIKNLIMKIDDDESYTLSLIHIFPRISL